MTRSGWWRAELVAELTGPRDPARVEALVSAYLAASEWESRPFEQRHPRVDRALVVMSWPNRILTEYLTLVARRVGDLVGCRWLGRSG
jgi:hypothetical protein